MREAPYTPPPTARDEHQSVAHHQDTVGFSLRHVRGHIDEAMRSPSGSRPHEYNLKHARGHADEALKHALALRDRLAEEPNFKTHYDRLDAPPSAERAEERAAKRGMSPARAERVERRLARGMGR